MRKDKDKEELSEILNYTKRFVIEYDKKDCLILMDDEYILIRFKLDNFPHLMGFSYKSFAKDYTSSKVVNSKIIKNKNFKVKIKNISLFFGFKSSSIMYSDRLNDRMYLNAKVAVGTSSFTVMFDEDKSSYYVLKSMLIGDTKKHCLDAKNIKLIIFKKNEEEVFSKITKKSKKFTQQDFENTISKLKIEHLFPKNFTL